MRDKSDYWYTNKTLIRRLQIIELEQQSMNTIIPFDMTKPSISHHLNALKRASLVTDERKGQNIYYSLNTIEFQEVIKWFFKATNINEGWIEDAKRERRNKSDGV
ncbi:transcriptional regulator [Desulfosporosinus fructosivorans]